jgi:hypothetical protein
VIQVMLRTTTLFAALVLFSPAASAAAGDVVVTGQVLGPDGKPCPAAKVYVSTYTAKDQADPKVRCTSGPDGRFRFTATRSEVDNNETVAAVAGGLGADWVELTALDRSGALPPLRLVRDDMPITGRVLDLENRPIAEATAKVVRVRKMPDEDLGPWIKDVQDQGKKSIFDIGRARNQMKYEQVMKPVWGILGAPHSVRADADGRFRLTGFGRERLVDIAVEAPGVEHRHVTVMTRGETPRGMPPFTFGARFEHRAAPAKPIVGTIREKGTGKPAVGVEVRCGLISGSGSLNDVMSGGSTSATTDDQGRYRLEGVPKAKQYIVAAAGGAYFASPQIVIDTAGLAPINVPFELERGLLLRGRLTDKATGKPVRGILYYMPRADNPHLKEYPGFAKISVNTGAVEKDGTFSVAVVPGPGWLCARANDDHYTRADFEGEMSSAPVLIQYAAFHALVSINPEEKAPKSLASEISLDSGRTLSGTVQGPDGKPLGGVQAAGLSAAYSPLHGSFPSTQLSSGAFTAVGLDPRRPRLVVFWHEEKKLARAVTVRGDESGQPAVRLERQASVAGRLLDADGRPRPGVGVEARYADRQNGTLPGELAKGIPGLISPVLSPPKATADPNGRFRVEGLVPGLNYDLFVKGDKKPLSLAKDIAASGGSCKDLGELRASAKAEK